MKPNDQLQRRAILAASLGFASFGGLSVNAQAMDEGKELLLAIKRIIDEDLIDKPEKASEILGLAIKDYRGPNEDVRPVPIIGINRGRKVFTEVTASIESSDQPQRPAFGIVELRISGFHNRTRDPIRINDVDVVAMFGDKFILASSLTRPHWRPGTDVSNWSGKYPNETFIYRLTQPRPIELLVSFGSQTQLTQSTLRIKKQGNTK
jgi:hypothetical protein